MRLPTYAQMRKFVEVEGWEDKDKASGKRTGDHHRYVFTTPSGNRLMTRVSHGSGQIGDRDLFAHILRDQLQATEEQFWDAVDSGTRPKRPTPDAEVPDGPLIDAKLARNLLVKVGLPPADLAGMTQQRAVEVWQEWLSHGADPGGTAESRTR
jgi:hypothetical protein